MKRFAPKVIVLPVDWIPKLIPIFTREIFSIIKKIIIKVKGKKEYA